MLKTHQFEGQASRDGDGGGRVEFLPVHWHGPLRGDDATMEGYVCNPPSCTHTHTHTYTHTHIHTHTHTHTHTYIVTHIPHAHTHIMGSPCLPYYDTRALIVNLSPSSLVSSFPSSSSLLPPHPHLSLSLSALPNPSSSLRQVKAITLASGTRLRDFTNSTLLDFLLYTSPAYYEVGWPFVQNYF